MNDVILRLATNVPPFLLAIVFHEAAHAWMALRYGDDTAQRSGRLTLNPSVHLDMMGTVLFPLIAIIFGGVMFGWAKPVPVNVSRFSNIKSGIFWVSFAGPLANVCLAVISALIFAIMVTQVPATSSFHTPITAMLRSSIMINVVLAVFNLIPFPPLDGSKMVSTFLDYEKARKFEDLQKYSMIFILFLWFTPFFQYLMAPAFMIVNYLLNFFIYIFG